MLQEVELEMSTVKTKFISLSEENLITIRSQKIKKLNEYVYLEHQIKLKNVNQKAEITKRVSMT